MGNIVMTRVDARLIHGQIANRWSKVTAAEQIVVIDNKTAADDFLTDLLYVAAPVGIKVVVYNEEQAIEHWKEDGFGPLKTLVIFQNIDGAKHCYDGGITYEAINIGQVPKAPGRKQANNTVHLSEAELNALIDLKDHGVNVYFHPTPEDRLVDLDTVVRKLRG